MTAKDVFGLIVRVMGLGPILYGFVGALGFVLRLIGLSSHPEINAVTAGAAAVGYIIIGTLFLTLAEALTRLAYGRSEPEARLP